MMDRDEALAAIEQAGQVLVGIAGDDSPSLWVIEESMLEVSLGVKALERLRDWVRDGVNSDDDYEGDQDEDPDALASAAVGL